MKATTPMATAALLLGLSTHVAAQSASRTVLESQRAGRQVLASGLEALGGIDRLRGVATTSLTGRVTRHMVGQSVRPGADPPARTSIYRLTRDLLHNRWLLEVLPSPDAQEALFRLAWSESDRFVHDVRNNTLRDVPRDDDGVGTLLRTMAFPSEILLDAWDRAETVRWLGRDDVSGYELVTYADTNGVQVTLTFDPASSFLVRSETVIDHAQLGDVIQQVAFADYRAEDGILVPYSITVATGPYTDSETEIVAFVVGTEIDDALFRRPEDATLQPAGPGGDPDAEPEVDELAPGVYEILNATPLYNVMFVEQEDGVVVIEAPGDVEGSERVRKLIRETLPGTQVKTLVLTHHHFDHSSGLWAYLRAGLPVVTTPGNAEFVHRVAAAPRNVLPSSEHLQPKLELVDGRRTFGTGANRFELIDVGPNPHADEILVVYFPEHRLLYVPDIYGYVPGFTPPPLLLAFAERMEQLALDVETIATAHTELSTIDEFWAMVEQVREAN